MIFKSTFSGKSKNTQQPFTMIELHDPETLENAKFFLRDGQQIDTSTLKFKEKITVKFEMGIQNGQPRMELAALSKI